MCELPYRRRLDLGVSRLSHAVKHLVLCRIVKRPPLLSLLGPSLSVLAPRSQQPQTNRTWGYLSVAAPCNDTPQLLLNHHLMSLKLPTFVQEYSSQARQCTAEGVDHVRYLVLPDRVMELIDRNAAWSSGGSGWPTSPPSKAWARCRLQEPCHRSTRSLFWKFRVDQ